MLEGTVNTPLGTIKKEYLLVGGGILLIVGVTYYKTRKAKQAAATAAAGANVGIDPATGYAYGSAEDAAALANQAQYINPTQPFAPGGGGSGNNIGPGGFTSNAQWSQYAISTLTANGSVQDAGKLSDALGKYITGRPVTEEEQSLIQMAIAIADKPPVAGPTGYPPSISVAAAPPPVQSGKLPAPTNMHADSGMFNRVNGQLVNNYINVGWDPVPGAIRYHYEERSQYGGQDFELESPGIHETGLQAPNTNHTVTVWPIDKEGNRGYSNSITIKTHDNY